MADSTKKNSGGRKKKAALIDPLYQRYTKSVIRALGSTEFYEFFMDAVSHAENEFQFSNRKLVKTVDLTWVDAIEETLEAFQNIIATPRNVIHEEELIVNVANAKKGGPDVVRHLAQHASLVENYDPKSGDVRPNKVMQKYREDSVSLYENRLVYTTMEHAYQFVKIRYDALFSAMSDEFGAKLKVRSCMESATELVHTDLFLHIKETDSALETDEKNNEVFSRISRMHRMLNVFMSSQFAQQMAKLPSVHGKATKTNVLKKNPNYRKIVKLWEFLQDYDEIGYTIRVTEQNPTINETFERDIYHNILFNYLILKGYLEDEKDREVPKTAKGRQRTLRPKFIREIIEELTEDYDLPEVEIRKVLIEELTKEQLMQEEAAERRRLVEEQAQRKKAEQERIRQEKAAEKDRLRKEREAEKERIRQEKAAEEERLYQERMERETEDRRRSKLLKKELERFMEQLPNQLEARETAAAKKAAEMQDFADAAQLLEEAEQRKTAEKERERKRQQEQRDQVRREKQLAKEQALRAEQERREQERLAQQAEEARLRAEEERLRREQEEEEERRRQEQLARDTAGTQVYCDELTAFMNELPQRMALRVQQKEQERAAREQWEQERRDRIAARAAGTVR